MNIRRLTFGDLQSGDQFVPLDEIETGGWVKIGYTGEAKQITFTHGESARHFNDADPVQLVAD